MIIANLQSLNEVDRATVLGHFGSKAAAAPVAAAAGKTKDLEAPAKKQNANKGKPTCHGDYVKKILEEQKGAMTAFKEANKELKGAHLVFVANYKKEHAEEFSIFEAAWKEAHPKVAEAVAAPKSVAEPKPVAEDDAVTVLSEPSGSTELSKMTGQELRDTWCTLLNKPTGLKSSGKLQNKAMLIAEIERLRALPVSAATEAPKRVMTDEQKAKMKAGREAAKAKKAAEVEQVVAKIEATVEAEVTAGSAAKDAAQVAISMAAELMGHGEVPEPVAEPVAEPVQQVKKRGAKKLEDMTAEELAKHNAKKAERKAKKAADALAGKPTVDTDTGSEVSAPSAPSARSTSPKLKDD